VRQRFFLGFQGSVLHSGTMDGMDGMAPDHSYTVYSTLAS